MNIGVFCMRMPKKDYTSRDLRDEVLGGYLLPDFQMLGKSGFLVTAAANQHPTETHSEDGHAHVLAWFRHCGAGVGSICTVAERERID